jgi:phytoene desaturase
VEDVFPILLVSYGVDRPMSDVPGTLVLDGMPTLRVGGREDAGLTVRIFNDEPAVAPPGHTVVQVQAQTDYAFWATRGTGYGAAKEAAAATLLSSLEPVLPGLRQSVRMTDVATPLTFWRNARSWRGAFEGWLPTPESFFGHVDKTLPGLKAFYMAGQWVEPGGGVPTALLSGRHAVQIACNDIGRPFASSTGA